MGVLFSYNPMPPETRHYSSKADQLTIWVPYGTILNSGAPRTAKMCFSKRFQGLGFRGFRRVSIGQKLSAHQKNVRLHLRK